MYSRTEIDIDTETDETDCEAIIDLEDNESCVENLETVHVNGDAGGDEEMTLEMRYESVLAGEFGMFYSCDVLVNETWFCFRNDLGGAGANVGHAAGPGRAPSRKGSAVACEAVESVAAPVAARNVEKVPGQADPGNGETARVATGEGHQDSAAADAR